MSIKTVNSLIIANKHEEAYKALLNIKPSFQVMITKTAADEEDTSAGVKQLSEEMKKMGIEEMAVIIYDGNTDPSYEEPTPYPEAVDAQLEQKVLLIIADVDSFKTDELVISYNETIEDLGSNNLVFEFPDEVKDLVDNTILYATDYDLDNCILVLRSSQMEYSLRNDETAFKDCQKQTQNTIYVSRGFMSRMEKCLEINEEKHEKLMSMVNAGVHVSKMKHDLELAMQATFHIYFISQSRAVNLRHMNMVLFNKIEEFTKLCKE